MAATVLMTGCNQSDDDDVTTSGSSEEIAFQFNTWSIVPEPDPAIVPQLTVYTDGQIVRSRADHGSLSEATIEADVVTGLLAEAEEAGIIAGSDPDAGDCAQPFEPTMTRVTVRDVVFDVCTLDPRGHEFEPEWTDEQQAIRGTLLTIQSRLSDEAGDDTTTYEPTALAVFAEPRPPGARTVTPWPIDSELEEGCVVVDGDDATTVLEEAVNSSDRWSSGGENWIVSLRPLLPHETDCPAA